VIVVAEGYNFELVGKMMQTIFSQFAFDGKEKVSIAPRLSYNATLERLVADLVDEFDDTQMFNKGTRMNPVQMQKFELETLKSKATVSSKLD
jgi:hypothetical protein